jgi:hypothetical protein
MTSLEKLEKQLDEWLNVKAPWKLPPDARNSIASAAWAIALVAGIVQLWSVWTLWHVGHYVNSVVTYQTYPYMTGPGGSLAIHLGFFYWVSFFIDALSAVFLLTAAPKLKKMEKGGWNLLYYAMLLEAVYAVFRLFAGVDGLFSDFIGAAISTLVGAYLLFQIRGRFMGHAKAPEHIVHEHESGRPEHDEQHVTRQSKD